MQGSFKFDVGMLVTHHRYGYRGVVADYDPRCRANDSWYKANRTHPSRNQPWYHVLVHGSDHTTYVAQENLKPYLGGEQVANPLTRHFFDSFSRGCYHLLDECEEDECEEDECEEDVRDEV